MPHLHKGISGQRCSISNGVTLGRFLYVRRKREDKNERSAECGGDFCQQGLYFGQDEGTTAQERVQRGEEGYGPGRRVVPGGGRCSG